jgi:hypothetical protein
MNLFHYTDAAAIKAIIEFNMMRLTDMRYLNDSEEVSHATRIVLEEVNSGKLHHRLNNDYAELASEYVVGQFKSLLEKKFSGHPIYSLSFSAAGDLLSQWRSYGSYSLEIDPEKWNCHLTQCIYDPERVRNRLFMPTIDALRAVGRDLRDYAGRVEYIGTESYMDLIKTIATVKHPGFSEEQEFRLLLDERSQHVDNVKYRVRSEMLIPFVEVPMPIECIVAVHVGPMKYQDMAYESMKDFADQISHVKQLSVPIKVGRSSIPYRTA